MNVGDNKDDGPIIGLELFRPHDILRVFQLTLSVISSPFAAGDSGVDVKRGEHVCILLFRPVTC